LNGNTVQSHSTLKQARWKSHAESFRIDDETHARQMQMLGLSVEPVHEREGISLVGFAVTILREQRQREWFQKHTRPRKNNFQAKPKEGV